MPNAKICSTEPRSAKLNVPKSETGGPRNSRCFDNLSEIAMTEPDNWRTALVRYLENPAHIANRKV
jgi:hypothetical protein